MASLIIDGTSNFQEISDDNFTAGRQDRFGVELQPEDIEMGMRDSHNSPHLICAMTQASAGLYHALQSASGIWPLRS